MFQNIFLGNSFKFGWMGWGQSLAGRFGFQKPNWEPILRSPWDSIISNWKRWWKKSAKTCNFRNPYFENILHKLAVSGIFFTKKESKYLSVSAYSCFIRKLSLWNFSCKSITFCLIQKICTVNKQPFFCVSFSIYAIIWMELI